MTVGKRIFNDEVDDNNEGKDDDEDSDRGESWMNEKRKKDNEIAMLKRKIKTLEIFNDEVDENDDGKDNDEDSDCVAHHGYMRRGRKTMRLPH